MKTPAQIIADIAAAKRPIDEQLFDMYRFDADKLLARLSYYTNLYYIKYKNQEEFVGNQIQVIEFNMSVDHLIEARRPEELEMLLMVMEKEVYRIQQMVPRRTRSSF